MVASKIVEKSCSFISEASCYEVARDFAGPALTAFAVIASIYIAFKQISKQHSNAIKAQKEETKRNTRIELFKDVSLLIEQSSAVIREVNSYCTVKNSIPDQVALLDHQEYSELSKRVIQALLLIVSKIESHEIVHPMLFKTFRYSLQSIVHDVMKLREDTTSTTCLKRMLEYTSDASCYLGDFQVCLQNLAYGDIFKNKITARVPIDKSLRVIEDDPKKLEALLNYFENESNWGVSCNKYENEAKAQFSS
ncbi:hypothetical protein F0223_16945 [Vibrio coralliilyticus]|uniref:hypothetical protein n=1 Tax=Vibrio TaxID=662 RepID=UPI0005029487|nr:MULTISPECIES: hypothetical protein [Vibrio]KFI10838.1 hypothetical protein IX95_18525 [Vibrio sp. B183]NOI19913.1 hypothetical protein [Vibrio coralliilyticus]